MPVVPPSKLAHLQKSVHNVRNVCVLAHVDHGKTTLSDALLATNGIISSKLAGKVRYLDSRQDEQERGITMESSGISLYYQLVKRTAQSDAAAAASDGAAIAEPEGPAASAEYLINVIDSPGHVDFASEVASAARLSDGALVLVDVVEGVCTQTVSVLRQAWLENVQPLLFLNKMDRLIVDWQMTPSEAYVHMQQLIEQVNAVLAGFWEGDRLAEDSRKLEEAKEKWRETHGDDAPMAEWYLEEKDDSQIYFSPEQGNVLFGSAVDGWAFRVNHFAHVFAEKLGIPTPAKLQQLMWGSYFLDPKNKHRVLTHKQLTKLYGPAKAATALPLFVQLCLLPIWQVYESVVLNHNQDKIEKVIAALELKVLPRDRRSKDRRVLLTAIMQGWLPLAQECMVAIVEQLPSPAAAQPLRIPPFIQGKAQPLADRKTTEPRTEVERALYCCTAGSTSHPVPLVAYIGKMVSVPRESLPDFSSEKAKGGRAAMTAEDMRALGRDALRRELASGRDSNTGTHLPASLVSDDLSRGGSGTATPQLAVPDQGSLVDSLASAMSEKLHIDQAANTTDSETRSDSDPDASEDEILVGFGRVYCGIVRVGDRIWALQPKYNAKEASSKSYCKQVTVRALYMMMGREFVSLAEVPAGCIFGIRGVAGAILKSGTLVSDTQTCPNLAAMHSETHPIVRVALEPANPQNMAKLVHGLELLNHADPCVQVILQATGERVLVTAGELHLERCMKDLRERFAKCDIHVSEPIVPFRESIVRQNAQPGVVLGEVGTNGQLLAIIPKSPQAGDTEPAELYHAKPEDDTPRGEVCITTINGLITITLQVEPLPDKTTRFLLRHEDDIRRLAKLSLSQRRGRLNAAAEALAGSDDAAVVVLAGNNNDSDGGDDEVRTAKPSRTSELGPWLQGRMRSTFRKAKGWDPLRAELVTDCGLRAFGPCRVGANMLIYAKDVLAQASKSETSWFRRRSHDTTASSAAATPMLSDDEGDNEDGEDSSAPTLELKPEQAAYTIRDFEESVNAGFQLATQSGPLCFEPLVGVAVTVKSFVHNKSSSTGGGEAGTSGLSGQIITAVRDAVKAGFLQWSPRLHLAMYTCDIQATSEVLGKAYGVINRRRGRILSEEMREGTPYFTIKSSIPIVESFGFADEIRKRTSGAAIPLLIYRGFEPLDVDPFWVPTTEEELEDLGEKADRDNVAKRYMDKVRQRKGLFVERKIVEHAEKQRTLKK
ncbi:Cytoplasmic GTPase/eEF2-like protein (ribosomal biogenesis) [Coemansia thaxteri]|uniref:Ribosome assembly protein 1 n=1 Tax=Coemansia thaxteri TaxID=2663907 RepID=A0A9W8EIA7_9FUNG|nr:Cytoplasmic GTPase/eEF2-like protein (ribosomal biogenesis) [Coemansia thaxteri]KAJ2488048.1 Cytoplasmic GTPase/eEF2-like protein (ribosomal biogenesis) [Coemansia sp. RSA 2320]